MWLRSPSGTSDANHTPADRSVNPTTLNPVLVKEDPRSEASEMAEALTTASDIAVGPFYEVRDDRL